MKTLDKINWLLMEQHHECGYDSRYKPNIIYLGCEEYYEVLVNIEDRHGRIAVDYYNTGEMKIYGVQVRRVVDPHYIAVGRVREWSEQNNDNN